MKKKFIIVTTTPISLYFFSGQIQTLKEIFDVEVVSSSGKLLDNFCKSEEIIGHTVEMKREISLINDLKSLFSMVYIYYKNSPDYIHGNTPKAGLISMISGWLTRVPKRIYYIHGLRYSGEQGFKRSVLKFIERTSCAFATDIFSVSVGVREALYEDFITRKKVNLIGHGSINGINLDYFSKKNINDHDARLKYKIKSSDFIFGFVGRVVADKGINELVNSFLKINKIHKNTKLLLVGPYEDKLDPLDSWIRREIEGNSNIIKLDYQNDVRVFYKIMNVFVFPSYREGFGVSLIEALSMELPIITTDTIGCNEVIQNDINGILVPKKSIDKLVEAMQDLILDKEKSLVLGSRGREIVSNKYDHDMVCKKTLTAYRNL